MREFMNIPNNDVFSFSNYHPINGPVGRYADASILPSNSSIDSYNNSLEANKIKESGYDRYRSYTPNSVVAQSLDDTSSDLSLIGSEVVGNLTNNFLNASDSAVSSSSPIIDNIASTVTDYVDELDKALSGNLREENNQLYKDYYYESMLHQIQGAENAMKFSAEQADLSRSWSEYMSNTAYQRAVSDMKKAGLNPMLMVAKGFSPASTPSSATASGFNVGTVNGQLDTNSYSVQAFTSILNSATQLIGNIAKAIGDIIPG